MFFVKCNNQKEWDFVLKQTGYTYVKSHDFGDYVAIKLFKDDCVNTGFTLDIDEKMLSFDEYCSKFDYNNPFKQQSGGFKVGEYLIAIGDWRSHNVKKGSIAKYVGNNEKGYLNIKWINPVDEKGNKVQQQDGNYKPDFRKAELHEIPVDKLTNDEILEVAKQFYKPGTKHMGYNGYKFEYVVGENLHWSSGNIYSDNRPGCIYYGQKKHWSKRDILQPEVKKDFIQEVKETGCLIYDTSSETQDPNEITIPKMVKTFKKLDLNLEKPTFAEIKIPVSNKPRKVLKPIIVEKFSLTI